MVAEVDIKGSLAPEVEAEIDNFQREAEEFQEGRGLGDEFRPFRLQHGIYGQRQAGVQMIRIKIPHGSLTADQLDVIADIADRYTSRKLGHVTTRQDIQLHFVQLSEVPTIMRLLAEAGLTTREACGNTVRNVTADHMSGLCPDTVFDVTPYAEAVARHCLRHPVTQKLPSKFKITFSACPHDHGLIPIHDLGAMAVLRDGKRGFRISVGGGLGAAPRVADVLEEFVPEEELARVTEAVLRVFDRLGERRNRNKARIKFLIAKVGIEEFRRLVKEELAQLPPADSGLYRQPDFSFDEESASHPPFVAGGTGGRVPADGFEAWRPTNAVPQRQAGFYMVYIGLPIGDITAQQMHQVADMARGYAGGKVRTANNQNLVLRWVHEVDLPYLHADLVTAGLGEPGALTLSDVMTCPGADTCSLGVTSSKGLGTVLRETILNGNGLLSDPLVRQIRIKVSGCPNSCGHHHIADIGFYGCAVHQNGRMVPAFSMLLGGRGDQEGVIARHVMKIATRRIPEAVTTLIQHYVADRRDGEIFRDYVHRVGTGYIQELLAEYKAMPEFEKDPMAYVDWGASKLFTLDDMGEGECSV